ncbi:hypothetical protein [Candidatus Uabimicrobium sp. HlEnr_7]|uniref:hypothetical protein n=1 Tax=Candidatus Uabimicrobium helgolandensis TaxID=3095367 RepID=UPI003558630A
MTHVPTYLDTGKSPAVIIDKKVPANRSPVTTRCQKRISIPSGTHFNLFDYLKQLDKDKKNK